MDQLTQFLQATLDGALTVVVIFLGGKAYQLLHQVWQVYVSANIQHFVALAVDAAEHSGIVGEIENEAQAKVNYAIDKAQQLLAQRGVKIDLKELEARVKSAFVTGFTDAENHGTSS